MEDVQSAKVLTREAAPAEHAEVARVTVEGYREYAGQMAPDAWAEYEIDLSDVSGRAARGVILVAEVDGAIAGALAYFPAGRIESDWLPRDWAYFRALAVLPAYRGRGVGRALTMACIARARSEGAAALSLHTTEGMPVARAMYERMGFVRHSERQGTTWKVWVYVMRLD
ncbi:MAG: hypothetical protein QOK05_584 [Chloroflexota bacterium]|nr:hypothetical protein [Chloroflexota bacterium]